MPVTPERAEAVLELFEAYYKRVFCFARRSLPTGDAEDIAQEVFTRLLEVRQLEQLSISVSYLIKIADNLIKRRYNRARRFDRYLEQKQGDGRRARGLKPRRNGRDDDLQELAESLEILAPKERDAVRLVVCEGLSYQEAADAMDAPVSSVNNWKYRGLQKLKDHHGAEDARQAG